MRVVIVGGAGFIGTALARSFADDGVDLLVLDTGSRLVRASSLLSDVEIQEFDFTQDRDARRFLRGADVLIHLGCTTNPGRSMESIAYDAESNIAPSLHLFDAAVKANVGRLIFSSSGGTVYGSPRRLPVMENDGGEPLSAYGVSKRAIESYLSLYKQLQGISLRIGNPYGIYQMGGTAIGVIARYVAAVRKCEPIEIWGDGSVVRDYIAIEDVVSAFRGVLSSSAIASGAYNIGTGKGSSVNEIINVISEISGTKVQVTYSQARPYDVPSIVLDSTRFRKATGWTARTSLPEGIAMLWRSLT